MTNINLPLSDELFEAVERTRGDVPRTVWIRRAIEDKLAADEHPAGSAERIRELDPALRRKRSAKR